MAQQNILNETLISSLIPVSANKILWAKSTDSLSQTLKTLVSNKIHSVPVFDVEKNKFVAFVDLIDFAVHLGKTYIENEIIEGSVTRMLQEEEHYQILQIANESHRNPWYTIKETQSLKEVIDLFVAHQVHRVAVLDSQGELKYVLTQSDIISFLANHSDSFSSLKKSNIGELNLGFKEVVTVTIHEKVWKSFIEMDSKGVSGLGIVDDNGQLVGHISCSDLKGVNFDSHLMDKLRLPVSNFKPELNVMSVLPTATFDEIVATLEKFQLHRVYIVSPDSKTPLGVISQSDVISVVFKSLK